MSRRFSAESYPSIVKRIERRRILAHDRRRRYELRRAAELACYWVEINAAVLNLLVRTRWLDEGEVMDARIVQRALSALLVDMAARG